MIKKFTSVLVLVTSIFFSAQNVEFDDIELKTYLLDATPTNYRATDMAGLWCKVDTNSDGEIQLSEAQNISRLTIKAWVKKIGGLEKFSNLTELTFSSDVMLALNLTPLPTLKKIGVSDCYVLSSLNLSGLPALEQLYISNVDKLNVIDLQSNTLLKQVSWTGLFTSTDFSGNSNLEEALLGSPNLVQLDFSSNPKFKFLRVYQDKLTQLNFANNPALENLYLQNTAITVLDLSLNSALNEVEIYGIALANLKLPDNSALKSLKLNGSQVQKIDVSKQTALTSLKLTGNQLDSLNVDQNGNLEDVHVLNETKIKTLDFSRQTKLDYLWFDQLANLEKLITKNGRTQNFVESYRNCPKLTYVCCDEAEKAFFISKNVRNVTTDCLLGTSEPQEATRLPFSPNPTSDQITFSVKPDRVKVYTTDGKLVISSKPVGNRMDVSSLKTGTYFMEIRSSNRSYLQKFIKK